MKNKNNIDYDVRLPDPNGVSGVCASNCNICGWSCDRNPQVENMIIVDDVEDGFGGSNIYWRKK